MSVIDWKTGSVYGRINGIAEAVIRITGDVYKRQDLVRIYQCSILEQSSLYLAVEGKKEFIPSSLESEEPDEELRREKMRKMAEKIRKVISVEKIQNRCV